MKIHSKQSKKGFTLIEILVVVAIIGTLAAISFPIGKSMINRGKAKDTQLRMKEFVTAMNAFNEDNGHLPFPGDKYPTNDVTLSGEKLRQVVRILLGNDYQNADFDGGNKKGKKYLDMPTAKGGKNGLEFYKDGKGLPRSIWDAWGEGFYIRVDYNLDNKLKQWHTSDTDQLVEGHTVIMLSRGGDRKKNGDDDVFSWK